MSTMTTGIITANGVEYATSNAAATMLGVTDTRIRDWRRRGLITGRTIRDGSTLRRVYTLTELWDAERATRLSTRGRRRAAQRPAA